MGTQKKIKKIIVACLLAAVFLPHSAYATIYQPGETLEPDCAPESANCGVATSTTSFVLNGQSVSTQTFATGTTGTDFGISSSGGVHTFNIPDASTLNRGLVTIGGQIFGGDKTFSDGAIFSGNFSTPRGGEYNTTGIQDDVDLGTGSYFHYGGNGDATFTGLAGGTDGRIIHILNDSNNNLTLNHNNSGSAVENRIETPSGFDVLVGPEQTVTLMYDAQSTEWHISSLPTTANSLEPFAFIQGGNGFAAAANLGTTDAYPFNLLTSGATRFTIATSSTTLTGAGATTLTSDNALSLTSAAGAALTITSGTTGALTLDSGTTGAVNLGTGSSAKTISIGNAIGATTLNLTSGSGGIAFIGNAAVAGANTFSTGSGTTTINSTSVTLAGNSTVLDMTGSGTLGLNTVTNRAITTGTGLTTLGGDLVVSGDDLFMGTNTSGYILVADGTNFNPVALSGDATINDAGVLSLNYTGGQAADATHKGFLTSIDWNMFNNKQDTLVFTPEDSANKSTNVLLGTSNVLYPSQNAVKTYVDNKEFGLVWHDPLELINVITATSTPVTSPVDLDAYIINTGGDIDDWAAFDPGDLIQFQTDHWELIKALTIGDEFGVSFKSNTAASGPMDGFDDYLVEVTGGSPGAFTYTFEAPENNDAVFVQNANAYYHDVSFTYSTHIAGWVQLSASIQQTFGNGLSLAGTLVSLGDLTSDWDQAGLFNINTAGDINLNGGDLKTSTSTASLFNENATTLNIGGAASLINVGAAGATLAGAGALTLTSGTTGALTLDSGTTGTVNVGTGNNAKTVNIGTGTAGNAINIGTNNTAADTIAVGSALDAFSLSSTGLSITTGGALTGVASIDTITYSATAITFAGAGALSSTGANALSLDSGTTGAVNVGTGSNAKTITLGNTTGATAVALNSGSGGITFTGNTSVAGANTFSTGSGTTTINSTSVTLAGNSTVLDMTGSGTLGLNTVTNRAITTGTGLFTTGGALTSTGALTAVGNFSTPMGSDYTTTGTQNDVDLGAGSYFRYTGIGVATFTGFAGGTEGRQIRLLNTSASNITLNHEDAGSLAANRILISSGSPISLSQNSSVTLLYDSAISRWRLVQIPASSAIIGTFAFINNGNAFGGTASLGTTDANAFNLITGGNTRFTLSSGAATLTGTGATTLTTNSTLALSSAAGSALTVTSGTTGALTLDSGTTGTVNVGTGNNAKTVNIGTGTAGNAINIGTNNTAADTIAVGSALDAFSLSSTGLNITTGGALTGVASIDTITYSATAITFAGAGALSSTGANALSLDSGTTGAVNVGTGSNAKTITLGNTTGATAVNLQSGTGNIGLQIAGTGTTGNVQIGAGGAGSATPDLLVLDVKSTAGDPTGTNGAIYYNANSNKFRCYQNGAWADCLPTGGDMQHAASYDTTEALTNIAASQVTLTSVSVTPTTATGDVYVRAKAEILSSNNTDQSLVLSIEDNATCTGSTLATNTLTITSGSGTIIGDFEIAGIEVDAGASSQSYSFCASTATGDSDIRFYELFATVIDTGADLAEVYTTNDADLEAGDVVSIDSTLETGVTKSAGIDDTNVIGVVSTRPGMLIGGVEKEGVQALPVALSGRVPVKVTTENGAIAPGDYLVPSSLPGVAMKSSGTGYAIGQAISAYEAEGVGTVLAFVRNFYLSETADLLGTISPNTSTDEEKNTLSDLVTSIQSESPQNALAAIMEKINARKRFLMDFTSARMSALRGYFEEMFTKKIHTEKLCVMKSDGSEVCVTGDDLENILEERPSVPTPEEVTIPEPETSNELSAEPVSEIPSEPEIEPALAEEPEIQEEPTAEPPPAPAGETTENLPQEPPTEEAVAAEITQ